MQMEIDLAPRSFKTMSTGLSSVSKRARSPEESEDHLHRPLKRRSLAAGNNSSRAFAQHSLQCFYPANGRHLSEDWVQQAGDLSIDSPFDSNPTNEDAMVSEDSDMVCLLLQLHCFTTSQLWTDRQHTIRTRETPFATSSDLF
ncbi:hypothetical protein VKT23_004120 [Stygiomarasmius scandens]|uniref:Uncharacterized protein n=1 Tax=Marasmiellus scandens TaxID=2682957 RepID=A0ABR1JZ19_9AGAR